VAENVTSSSECLVVIDSGQYTLASYYLLQKKGKAKESSLYSDFMMVVQCMLKNVSSCQSHQYRVRKQHFKG
jgi:hypothetical protein